MRGVTMARFTMANAKAEALAMTFEGYTEVTYSDAYDNHTVWTIVFTAKRDGQPVEIFVDFDKDTRECNAYEA